MAPLLHRAAITRQLVLIFIPAYVELALDRAADRSRKMPHFFVF